MVNRPSTPAEAFEQFLAMAEDLGAFEDDELLGRIAAHRNLPAESLPRLEALARAITGSPKRAETWPRRLRRLRAANGI